MLLVYSLILQYSQRNQRAFLQLICLDPYRINLIRQYLIKEIHAWKFRVQNIGYCFLLGTT